LAATLTGSTGPIANAALTFVFRGVTYQATTGPDGRATMLTTKQSGPPGVYQVVVSFAGTDRYDASETVATVRIGR
jgi:hypothetical protein